MSESVDHAYFLSRRCRSVNDSTIRRGSGDYVLCWLQQTLRGENNPVIDAAVALGNSLGLPVVIYHGLEQTHPYASDRLHHFILEASRSLERDVEARGLKFVRVIERPAREVKGVVYQLATRAAALIVDDNAAFVGRWQLQTVAAKLEKAVIAVDGARLIPEIALGSFCSPLRHSALASMICGASGWKSLWAYRQPGSLSPRNLPLNTISSVPMMRILLAGSINATLIIRCHRFGAARATGRQRSADWYGQRST